MFLYQVLRPLAYLTIKHKRKYVFDWLAPIGCGLITVYAISLAHGGIKLFGADSIVDMVLSFISVLPGFYIAALAAIATFNRHDIDKPMPSPTPTIKIRLGDHLNTIDLSRRRFLSILFAFLTFESMAIAVFSIILMACSDLINTHLPMQFQLALFAIYITVFWQLITATLLGLYYLGDKLHQPD